MKRGKQHEVLTGTGSHRYRSGVCVWEILFFLKKPKDSAKPFMDNTIGITETEVTRLGGEKSVQISVVELQFYGRLLEGDMKKGAVAGFKKGANLDVNFKTIRTMGLLRTTPVELGLVRVQLKGHYEVRPFAASSLGFLGVDPKNQRNIKVVTCTWLAEQDVPIADGSQCNRRIRTAFGVDLPSQLSAISTEVKDYDITKHLKLE